MKVVNIDGPSAQISKLDGQSSVTGVAIVRYHAVQSEPLYSAREQKVIGIGKHRWRQAKPYRAPLWRLVDMQPSAGTGVGETHHLVIVEELHADFGRPRYLCGLGKFARQRESRADQIRAYVQSRDVLVLRTHEQVCREIYPTFCNAGIIQLQHVQNIVVACAAFHSEHHEASIVAGAEARRRTECGPGNGGGPQTVGVAVTERAGQIGKCNAQVRHLEIGIYQLDLHIHLQSVFVRFLLAERNEQLAVEAHITRPAPSRHHEAQRVAQRCGANEVQKVLGGRPGNQIHGSKVSSVQQLHPRARAQGGARRSSRLEFHPRTGPCHDELTKYVGYLGPVLVVANAHATQPAAEFNAPVAFARLAMHMSVQGKSRGNQGAFTGPFSQPPTQTLRKGVGHVAAGLIQVHLIQRDEQRQTLLASVFGPSNGEAARHAVGGRSPLDLRPTQTQIAILGPQLHHTLGVSQLPGIRKGIRKAQCQILAVETELHAAPEADELARATAHVWRAPIAIEIQIRKAGRKSHLQLRPLHTRTHVQCRRVRIQRTEPAAGAFQATQRLGQEIRGAGNIQAAGPQLRVVRLHIQPQLRQLPAHGGGIEVGGRVGQAQQIDHPTVCLIRPRNAPSEFHGHRHLVGKHEIVCHQIEQSARHIPLAMPLQIQARHQEMFQSGQTCGNGQLLQSDAHLHLVLPHGPKSVLCLQLKPASTLLLAGARGSR